jgi:hypothetical protein
MIDSKEMPRLDLCWLRRFLDADWLSFALASLEKKISKAEGCGSFRLEHHNTTYTMESNAAETKVQIRLSTRDPGLQIAEEPTVLLVQTCK